MIWADIHIVFVDGSQSVFHVFSVMFWICGRLPTRIKDIDRKLKRATAKMSYAY